MRQTKKKVKNKTSLKPNDVDRRETAEVPSAFSNLCCDYYAQLVLEYGKLVTFQFCQKLKIDVNDCTKEKFENALSDFQERNGLKKNGILNDETLEALSREVICASLKIKSILTEQAVVDAIKLNKKALATDVREDVLTFLNVPVNASNEEIVRHIAQFQIQNHLECTGAVDARLLEMCTLDDNCDTQLDFNSTVLHAQKSRTYGREDDGFYSVRKTRSAKPVIAESTEDEFSWSSLENDDLFEELRDDIQSKINFINKCLEILRHSLSKPENGFEVIEDTDCADNDAHIDGRAVDLKTDGQLLNISRALEELTNKGVLYGLHWNIHKDHIHLEIGKATIF